MVELSRRALPVERATSREKGQPLCMAQYYRLFSSYRVPGLQQDTLVTTSPSAEHVIVACANQVPTPYTSTPAPACTALCMLLFLFISLFSWQYEKRDSIIFLFILLVFLLFTQICLRECYFIICFYKSVQTSTAENVHAMHFYMNYKT